MKSIIFLVLLLTLSSLTIQSNFRKAAHGSHWAVLVAGSNGYWNYRHQADIFHAYQLLIKNGLSKDRIIVFAYDDVANNSYNPYKGQVFNKPSPKAPGVDVYAGVTIDYKGRDVDPEVFLNVLSGNKAAVNGKGSGRVLESTKDDNVFIYFSDHGAPGLIAFPHSELYAEDLIKTLKQMNEEQRYNELVFYLEACESGSMFNKILPENINIYATTAANPDESSWAFYCSPQDVVNGKSIGSCLGDEYSISWLEDTENENSLSETLEEQYELVKKRTKGSHVMQYGSKDFVNEPISHFVAKEDESLFSKVPEYLKKIFKALRIQETSKKVEENANVSKINSRDVKRAYFAQQAEKSDLFQSAYAAYESLISKTDEIFKTYSEIFMVDANESIVNLDINTECLKYSIKQYKQHCEWDEYTLKYIRNMAMACRYEPSEDLVRDIFRNLC